jgi:hypothetical protein
VTGAGQVIDRVGQERSSQASAPVSRDDRPVQAADPYRFSRRFDSMAVCRAKADDTDQPAIKAKQVLERRGRPARGLARHSAAWSGSNGDPGASASDQE